MHTRIRYTPIVHVPCTAYILLLLLLLLLAAAAAGQKYVTYRGYVQGVLEQLVGPIFPVIERLDLYSGKVKELSRLFTFPFLFYPDVRFGYVYIYILELDNFV